MASEFLVLSILHRLGLDAALTLTSHKAVDILVPLEAGRAVTLDVKGAAGINGFFVDSQMEPRRNHVVVFVTYLGRFGDPAMQPEMFVVPSADVPLIAKHYPSGKCLVQLNELRNHSPPYRDNWRVIAESA